MKRSQFVLGGLFIAAAASCDTFAPSVPRLASRPVPVALRQALGSAKTSPEPGLSSGAAADADSRAAGGVEPPTESEDLTLRLDEAVRMAIENNFQIKVADKGRDIGRRNWVVEKAVFDPYFSASSDYSKNRAPTSSFLDIGVGGLQPVITVNPFETNAYSGAIGGRTILGTEYSLSLSQNWFDRPLAEGSLFGINPQSEVNASIQITQPLLKSAWHQYNSSRLRIAVNDRIAADHQLELTASELVFQTESAYWQLSYAIKNHETQEQLLRTANENLEIAREERAAGAASEVDVIVAGSQLALRKVEFHAARTLLSNTRDQLLLLLNKTGVRSLKNRWESGLGGTDFGEITVTPISEPRSAPFTPDRDVALRFAFENRADYKQLQIEIDNKRIQVAAAKNETLPELGVTATP